MTKIKLCGIHLKENIPTINEVNPDFVGFVFAENSRKYVTPKHAKTLRNLIKLNIPAFGVFVDTSADEILRLYENAIIDGIQLHGGQDNEFISYLKARTPAPIIQAVSIGDTVPALSTFADCYLFDNGKGGTGKTFDWSKIPTIDKPYFLAGGINLTNLEDALNVTPKPFCIDISSGIENHNNSRKHMATNSELIREVVTKFKKLQNTEA